MTPDIPAARRDLRRAAYLFLGTVAALAFGVLPQVAADSFPGATPQRALPALWTISALYVVAGGALMGYAPHAHARTTIGAWLCLLIGFMAAFGAGPLFDASGSYAGHGPALHLSAWVLALSAVASIASLVLIVRAWLRLPGHDPLSRGIE